MKKGIYVCDLCGNDTQVRKFRFVRLDDLDGLPKEKIVQGEIPTFEIDVCQGCIGGRNLQKIVDNMREIPQ